MIYQVCRRPVTSSSFITAEESYPPRRAPAMKLYVAFVSACAQWPEEDNVVKTHNDAGAPVELGRNGPQTKVYKNSRNASNLFSFFSE